MKTLFTRQQKIGLLFTFLLSFLSAFIINPVLAENTGQQAVSDNNNSSFSTLVSHGGEKNLGGWIGLSAINLAEGDVKECYIVINPNATEGFDLLYDAEFQPGEGPVFYTESNGVRLSTNSIPEFNSQTNMQFIFSATENGAYQIEAYGLELIEQQVYLYDQLAKSDHNLSMDPVYHFEASIGQDSSRFMLHFQPTGIGKTEYNQLNVYPLNGEMRIENVTEQTSISIYSTGGICQYAKPLSFTGNGSIPVHLPRGIYIVKLNSISSNLVKKVFIP
jgi:hypothetical protein